MHAGACSVMRNVVRSMAGVVDHALISNDITHATNKTDLHRTHTFNDTACKAATERMAKVHSTAALAGAYELAPASFDAPTCMKLHHNLIIVVGGE
jgi:hypothetical protein